MTEGSQTSRLTSRWEGEGERFTLVVGTSSDGLHDTPEEEYEQWQMEFGRCVQRTLAEEFGYDNVTVEVVEAHDVGTIASAGAHRADWEMAEALGPDLWAALTDRAAADAWTMVEEAQDAKAT